MEANITPIFKKDDPTVVSNYRHISLKCCRRSLGKKLFDYVRDHKILSALQSGFTAQSGAGGRENCFTSH